MSRTAWERWIFCAVSFVLLFFAAMCRPTIYGNSPGEITRYLRREMADRGTGPYFEPALFLADGRSYLVQTNDDLHVLTHLQGPYPKDFTTG